MICKKKQELLLKTGGWFSPGTEAHKATPAETIENLLNEREGRRLSRSNSLQENGPVRLRSSLEKSNSFDQHDRQRGAFTPRSPRGTQGVQTLPVSPRPNYGGHNGYGTPRGLAISPRSSPRPSPRPIPLATRPSLSDDEVESPPGSDFEGFADPRDSRMGASKGGSKKSVSFRDGHDEYRPIGMQRSRRESLERDGQQAARVRRIVRLFAGDCQAIGGRLSGFWRVVALFLVVRAPE